MKKALILSIVISIWSINSLSSPLIWEDNIGPPLNHLTSEDDAHQMIGLNFNFPFKSTSTSETVYSVISNYSLFVLRA